jgi:hypothetical protein
MLLRAARDVQPSPGTKSLGSEVRCRACQLQLCKSRTEKPHTGLKEVGRDEVKQQVQYACETCAAVMEWCGDPTRPGWTHKR